MKSPPMPDVLFPLMKIVHQWDRGETGFIHQVPAVLMNLYSQGEARVPFTQLPGQTLQSHHHLPDLFARTTDHFPGQHAGSSPVTAAGCNISRPTPAQ